MHHSMHTIQYAIQSITVLQKADWWTAETGAWHMQPCCIHHVSHYGPTAPLSTEFLVKQTSQLVLSASIMQAPLSVPLPPILCTIWPTAKSTAQKVTTIWNACLGIRLSCSKVWRIQCHSCIVIQLTRENKVITMRRQLSASFWGPMGKTAFGEVV